MHRLSYALMALVLLAASAAAHAVTRNYTLYITSGNLTINGAGGAALPVLSYTDVPGAIRIPGVGLTANEGDVLNVTVVNNHNVNHNFIVKGITTDATAIPPGGSRAYSFTASAAGTYLYYDSLNSNINREMGLYGTLQVAPADGGNRAWTNGPAFDFQRTWVVGEMDKPRWNDVAGSGGSVNTSVYKPNYFIINGKGGFEGMEDPATTIDGAVGQKALVRIVNGGQFAHALHFHGNHFEVLAVNGVRQSAPYKSLDVVNVPPLSTVDILYTLNQLGNYVMHVHTAQMETANGVYLNGVGTLIHMR